MDIATVGYNNSVIITLISCIQTSPNKTPKTIDSFPDN